MVFFNIAISWQYNCFIHVLSAEVAFGYFLDVAVNLPDNKFLEDNDIIPGTQNTALDDKMKQVARQLFIMTNGEYGSKQISKTVGGCAMNTSRAANFYLQAQFGTESSLVYTLGCVGKDSAGT